MRQRHDQSAVLLVRFRLDLVNKVVPSRGNRVVLNSGSQVAPDSGNRVIFNRGNSATSTESAE